MGRYVLRRLLYTIPVLIGASFFIFAMVFALPGDPIRALAGDRPFPPAVAAALTEEYNLDDPLLVQYGKYIWGLLQGDFGTAFNGREVADIIAQRLPVTVQLAVVAIIFTAVFGLTAGILAGLRRNSWLDNLVLVTTMLAVGIPTFVLGFLTQYAFGLRLGLFPVAGITQGWYSFLLPGFVLAAISLGYVARLSRTSLVENLRDDYVRTAKAKGVRPASIIGRHTLRNSLIPVVTFLGADFGALMGGAIITEGVFNVPGLGRAVFDAVRSQEGPVVVGIVSLFVFTYIFVNLAVDIVYALLDPRIRYE
jgi:peptide/nickel transport system permease protein/oligopeptide transport system permease protein